MSLRQTGNELIRAALIRAGLYDFVRSIRGKSLKHLGYDQLEDRFAHIYRTRMWALGDENNPASGSGSSLYATSNLREKLPLLVNAIHGRRILDIGCGDFTWMKEVKLSGIEYIGCDIVADVINENAEKFGGDKIHFVHCNALEDELPDADVILAREILFHLSFADIFSVLRNAVSKQRSWLLITSDQLSSFNTDICSGDWRLLNLQRAPFNFPNPVYSIDDSGVCPNRKLMAWTGAQISETLRS